MRWCATHHTGFNAYCAGCAERFHDAGLSWEQAIGEAERHADRVEAKRETKRKALAGSAGEGPGSGRCGVRSEPIPGTVRGTVPPSIEVRQPNLDRLPHPRERRAEMSASFAGGLGPRTHIGETVETTEQCACVASQSRSIGNIPSERLPTKRP